MMMKNTMVLCGAAGLALALWLAACPEDSDSGPNTAMKSITITDIPALTMLEKCAVRENISSLFNTAVAEDPAPEYTDTKTFELHLAGDENTRWRGSGDYFVVLQDTSIPRKEYWYTNGAEWTSSSDSRKRCTINSAGKTIPFGKFKLKP
jgi:ABC-type uncharacterized transport system auxiliary subunit